MSLMTELKRRNVFRVGLAYAIVGWLLIEVASVLLPTFEAPAWVMKAFSSLVILGFPLTLVIAWAFEMTPEGIKREAEVDRTESITHVTGRKLDFAIIGLLVIAVVYFAVDKFGNGEPKPPPVAPKEIPAAEAVEREKSIAVLLFDNLSGDAANEAFTKGIHDDILTHLSKIRALKVIARTSMERLDPTLSIPEIGTQLGVAAVLEGGVQRSGDRVRINVQLIDCETEAHLWAETYDRELTASNIFSIQSEIAKTVADALRATLSLEEKQQLDTVPTENMAAYEAYILGKQRIAKGTSGAFSEAADFFQRAVELDPGFALAYVGLADAYVNNVDLLGLPKNEMYSKAGVLIERALELDDQLGEAYAVLASIQDWSTDFEDAEAKFRRALELNPNYARAYLDYGQLLRKFGRPEEALALHRKAVELDPLSPVMIMNVGWSLDALGRFDEGLSWYERSFDLDPAYSFNLWNIGTHYWLISGQYGEAVGWLRKAISSDPGDPFNSAHLGRLFMDLGDSDRAEYWIHRSIETDSESSASNNAMQLLHLYQRDEAAGLEYGRKSFAIAEGVFLHIAAVELLGDYEVRAGRYPEARDLYAERYPELLREDDPKIHHKNYRAAINLALVLSKTGEQERADLLLDRSLRHIETAPRLSLYGYGIADVEIYALQGDTQKALSTLRLAIDEGWRGFWWYLLKHDPTLESLHDEPEFQAIVAEIEADMAAQLERVREMERSGELTAIPELVAE